MQWLKPHCVRAFRNCNAGQVERDRINREIMSENVFRLARAIARDEEDRKGMKARRKSAEIRKGLIRAKRIRFH